MRPYPISAADHIVLEKIGGLELLEDAFTSRGLVLARGTGPIFFMSMVVSGMCSSRLERCAGKRFPEPT